MNRLSIWNPANGKPRYISNLRINHAHPLNACLTHWYLLNEGGGYTAYEIVRSLKATGSATYPVGWNAKGVTFPASNRSLKMLNVGYNGPYLGNGGENSIVVMALFTANAAWQGCVTNSASVGILWSDGSHVDSWYSGDKVFSDLHWISAGSAQQTVALSCNKGALNAWLNMVKSATTNTLTIHSQQVYIGNDTNPGTSGDYWRGTIISVWAYQRQISQAEVMEMNVHPFGTLANPRILASSRPMFFLANVASTGIRPLVNTNQLKSLAGEGLVC